MTGSIIKSLVTSIMLISAQASAAEPLEPKLDRLAAEGMQRSGSQGLAIAVIDGGRVTLVKSWGKRNGKGDPLTTDTVMYAASLTKAMFGYLVASKWQQAVLIDKKAR